MKLIESGVLVILLAQLIGCTAKPLLTSSEKDVGAVLQPIAKSNIVDARAEFREVFCSVNIDHGSDLPDYRDCNDSLHQLSDEPIIQSTGGFNVAFRNKIHILVIPGIFGECLIDEVSPFSYAIDHLNQYPNIYIEVLPGILGRASSKHNSDIIHRYLQKFDKKDNEKLIIIAYSKGTTDMLHYLSDNDHADSYEKIDAMTSIAGVVNGTPIADDTNFAIRFLAESFPYKKCPAQDASGIDDLTRENQLNRLFQQQLPKHIQYFSMAAYAKKENISSMLRSSYKRLALVDPRNDGQVIYFDSVIPGAHLLGYANADHWAVALPFSRHINSLGCLNKTLANLADINAFPREVLIESIIRYIDSKL